MADTVKDGVTGVGRFLSKSLSTVTEKINSATPKEAAIFAIGSLVFLTVLLQFIIGFYEAYMPSMLWGLIKFICYLVIPLVALGSAFAGMWLEHKFQKFDEVHALLQDKLPGVFKRD